MAKEFRCILVIDNFWVHFQVMGKRQSLLPSIELIKRPQRFAGGGLYSFYA